MKIIFDYNRTIFDPDTQKLFFGVFDLLKELSDDHQLFVIGKKEAGREKMLDNLGIINFFDKVIFVDDKSVEVFQEVGGTEERVIVVGDRIYEEITVGNKLNYITVWVKQGKFSDQHPGNEEQEPKHVITDIRELKEIIKKYE